MKQIKPVGWQEIFLWIKNETVNQFSDLFSYFSLCHKGSTFRGKNIDKVYIDHSKLTLAKSWKAVNSSFFTYILCLRIKCSWKKRNFDIYGLNLAPDVFTGPFYALVTTKPYRLNKPQILCFKIIRPSLWMWWQCNLWTKDDHKFVKDCFWNLASTDAWPEKN